MVGSTVRTVPSIFTGHIGRERTCELAFGALHIDLAVLDVDGDALWDVHHALADARLANAFDEASRLNSLLSHHQTSQRSSPPTRCLRASRSVMTPRLVLRIDTPRPERTRGMRSWRT